MDYKEEYNNLLKRLSDSMHSNGEASRIALAGTRENEHHYHRGAANEIYLILESINGLPKI